VAAALEGIARRSGTFAVGGDMEVVRLGYGSMRITGPGIWGPPSNRNEAIQVLRRCVDLGITFIDTADSYGPDVSEPLIAAALHPYPDDLIIGTKAGFTRQGPEQWTPVGVPAYLRQQCELSLRRLKLDRIDLFQLHRIDDAVALEDQIGELRDLQSEGKVRHIGLCEVSVEQIEKAGEIADIAAVQNRFSFATRSAANVLAHCHHHDIAFIPWRPIADITDDPWLRRVATAHDATPAQVGLAWLLRLTPVMVPIPGTSTVEHLEENAAAAAITLTDDEFEMLTAGHS